MSGRYRIEQPLGHGGMAVVYRAYDEALGRVVAVKLLAENLAGEESFRRRFLREARLAARLAHPNIVYVYDTGEDEGRPFIVMECVEGESLAELLAREHKLEPGRAVALARQACLGLQHAHEQGLVHRDLKPQNLLLDSAGTLKIADFGIARSAQGTRLTEIGSVLGTAAYLAPEQATGEQATTAADIYSLGVVIYQMLAGVTPFSYESLADFLHGQTQLVPPLADLAPAVPPALEETVMRTLAREPRYRPLSAAALAHELAAALPGTATEPLPGAGGMPSHRPETAPTRLSLTQLITTPLRRVRSNWGRRRAGRGGERRAWLVVLAVLLAAAALALGLVLATSGGSNAPERRPAVAPAAGKGAPAEQARALARWLRAHSSR